MKVPFLDLKREIVKIKDPINDKMNEIFYEKTNFILGKELEEFENNFSKYIGVKHCIGVANGTDALEIAVKSLNLSEDSEIITQANTYVATCFGVTSNNIKLRLVDIDEDTYQMDLNKLEEKINKNTKAIIIVHLTGSCCNMNKLMKIVEKHNLILIEDCAQSHGAYFDNKRLGTYGHLSTFSFYPGKNLGAFGDGGAICTKDDRFNLKIRKIRNNGSIEKYIHEIYGRNSRLDTMQAAILDIKLKYLDENNEKRRQNALLYSKLLQDVKQIELPKIEENCVPVYHLFIIRCNNRNHLQKYLKEKNIQTGIHYPTSITKLKCYENYFNDAIEKAINNERKILSLPMFPDLTKEEITYVCDFIKNFYKL